MSQNLISAFLDFFIPRFCTVCASPLSTSEKLICHECENSIQFLTENQIQSEFQRKFCKNNIIDDYTSLFLFEEGDALQKLIHALKYDKKFKIGIYLGQKLGQFRNNIVKSWNADFIVPVPLYNLRRIERGYNQSFYLAKGLGYETRIPIKNTLLKRSKNTVSQTTLNLNERKENLSKAFTLTNKKKVRSKRVIILDDVITTGATVSELARTLKENGVEKVFAISIATPPISHSIGGTDSKNS